MAPRSNQEALQRQQEQQQQHQGQRASGQQQQRSPGNTAATVNPAHWLLTALRLLAVQPACLPVHRPGDHHAVPAPDHHLLLQLEAATGAAPPPVAATPGASVGLGADAAGRLASPMPLSSAVLTLAVRDRHTQQPIMQLQVPLHLLLLLPAGQPQAWDLDSSSSISSIGSPCTGLGTTSTTTVSSSSTSEGSTISISITSTCPDDSSSSSSLASLSLAVTFPARPSDRDLDAHLLVLTAAVAGSDQSAVLVAEVPLLLLPGEAQQEVQQLLLPAMRQEAQQAVLSLAGDSLSLAELCTQVEAAVFQHFRQLAQDVYVVMQVADQVAATTAAAAGAAQQQQAAAAPPPSVLGVELWSCVGRLQPAAALAHLAGSLLFPLLLPFLASCGLHSMLRLLLQCLPPPLQERWQQQQEQQQQQELMQAQPVAVEVQPGAQEQPQQQLGPPELPLPQSSSSSSTASSGIAPPPAGTDSPDHRCCTTRPCQHADPGLAKLFEVLKPANQQQQRHSNDASDTGPPTAECSMQASASTTAGSSSSGVATASGVALEPGAGASPAAAAAAAVSVPWHLPLTGFSGGMEARYVAWKHAFLLHLDYVAVAFGTAYLAVVIGRMRSDAAAAGYAMFVLLKVLPHVPLALGFRHAYLRHRELWLFLIGPATALLTWLAAARSVYVLKQPPLLLTASALKAFWQGRGELATSTMRPLMQHMRLKPYAAYMLFDTAVTTWVFAQVFGVASAAPRCGFAAVLSVALCWALDLHMRRLFVAQQGRRAARQAAHGSPVNGGSPVASSVAVRSKQKRA